MYLPILTYHRLLKGSTSRWNDPARISVSDRQFRAQMKWLQSHGYRTVGLNDYGARLRRKEPHAGKCVAITFDDGYEEVLTLAAPILQEFGFTATVFAVPGQLGGHNAWDEGHARLLTADQYRVLERAGFEIGAHTCNHVHLPKVDEGTARREIADSKKRLEDFIGKPVKAFAYPYGETTDPIDRLVEEAGFEAGFATDRAPKNHEANPYRIRRVVIFPKTGTWSLSWKVQSWYPAYQDLTRK